MPKKKDLPSMPFYVGDWKKDPGVQALDRYQKSLWFDMICIMWESEDRGYLSFNNEAIPLNLLANMLGENEKQLKKNIAFFEKLNLFSRDKNGRIYSRKIINILQLSDKRRLAGLASAQQRVEQMVNKTSTRPPTTTENENEYEYAIKTIFKNYPTRCFLKGSSTGKNKKNKIQIKNLLKEMSFDEIMEIQKLYVGDCIENKTYLKNYSTLLNNFPEKSSFEKIEPVKPKSAMDKYEL